MDLNEGWLSSASANALLYSAIPLYAAASVNAATFKKALRFILRRHQGWVTPPPTLYYLLPDPFFTTPRP